MAESLVKSFWKDNPCVPSWKEFLKSCWNGSPPHLLHADRFRFPVFNSLPAGYTIRRLQTYQEAKAVSEFWNRCYSTSSACVCVVPADHIYWSVGRAWELWIVISPKGDLVGTGCRRLLPDLTLSGTVWKQAGMIDYFCVHPAHRKKGIGRAILLHLHNSLPIPHPPQLMCWETVLVSMPPLIGGTYYSWKRKTVGKETLALPEQILDQEEIQTIWKRLCKKKQIYTEVIGSQLKEVTLWKTHAGSVALWNTYHTSIPEGYRIGILLAVESEDCVKEICEKGPFPILLSTVKREGWESDSPMNWIAYNLCVGASFGGEEFPLLCL